MDAFTQFQTNPTVQRIAKGLSLPLRLPTLVRRTAETDVQRPLAGRKVRLIGVAGDALPRALTELGASLEDSDRLDALIVEAPAQQLYATLHDRLKQLAPHCRVLLLARWPKKPTPRDHGNIDGITGFAKSLARELGQKAITVNVLEIEAGASEESVARAVSYFATDRPRYVTAQRIVLGAGKAGGLSLAGEHAIVTGGARGIGAAIAEILMRQGARVTIADLASAKETANPKAAFVAADVTKDADVAALFAAAKDATILVNNAGITRDKTFAKLTQEKWEQVIAVNYEASVKCAETFLASGKGKSIVFLSSVVGIAGNFGQTNYTLSKAAVIGHVRALAEAQKEVRVNAIAPGFIDTVLTREVPLLNREAGKQMTCLLQAGEPEDIGELVAFLAAPASAAINGQTLRVCGGMFMGA